MMSPPYSKVSPVLLELPSVDKAVVGLPSDIEADSATDGQVFWAKGKYPRGDFPISA